MSDLDRQASGIQGFEPEYECSPACKKCGGEMDWAECWMIDCEEGYYDLGEQDCINYDPGTYAKCEECEGRGGWWYCPNKACSSDSANPSPDA